uniref:EF-hand domain-containing protein n=1 Tax=Paramoeba aestuarina TaxID=180227 RepID=A0A7S4JW00_9EUKA|mmetsp:Transcript_13520/g.20914  ORF Transcript_13520/g.20914 Transcript_13520/m.20914 type:complete len:319 (+) Transcript_13520:295-1251(+)|eukprot:CAMPEP_0201512318 /NCGR_PEP_ID=MMETSP0161_2-20130828/4603_1 /ASSEMBLY_ACC=CAM_ASM_000251 /TAXON_ID=180227 /ORGANISM="Neoparamoeba aestuarina, Strain SoJaBio B1-5/56/2" /LENGTH=318 /DNA_ID=CAMNT_0047908133 /DNA_START=199 /DNA_END=1155 /DNA_ORIENTATION=+
MAADDQDVEDWATKFVTQNPNPISSAVVAEVWEKYDAEKAGVISEEQAKKFLGDLASRESVTLEDEALTAMIEECSDEEGKFTFAAFKKLVAEWAASNEFDLSVSMQAELDTEEGGDANFTGLRVSGFRRFDWNRDWIQDEKTNDGKPVYSAKAYKVTFLMYFRAEEKRWVIDDTISANGSYYSHSSDENLSGTWHTGCSWTTDAKIKVTKVENDKGHEKEAYEMEGNSCNDNANGVYLRLPADQDINGKPHYVKKDEPERHLFYTQRERLWQVCPVAAEDKGAYAIASSLKGPWMVIPGDKEEKGIEVKKFEGGVEV